MGKNTTINYNTFGYTEDNVPTLEIARKILKENIKNLAEDFKNQLDFSNEDSCYFDFADRNIPFCIDGNVSYEWQYEWNGGDGWNEPSEYDKTNVENIEVNLENAYFIINGGEQEIEFTNEEKLELENMFIKIAENS